MPGHASAQQTQRYLKLPLLRDDCSASAFEEPLGPDFGEGASRGGAGTRADHPPRLGVHFEDGFVLCFAVSAS